jgi:hypothetical protein
MAVKDMTREQFRAMIEALQQIAKEQQTKK